MGKNETKFKEYLSRKARTLKGNSQNRGITLIALIITIIILLILAAVTLAVLKDTNLLENSKRAREKHIIGEEKEAIALAWNSSTVEYAGDVTKITSNDLEEELKKLGKDAKVKDDVENEKPVFRITYQKTEHEYTLDKNGNITGPTNTTPSQDNSSTITLDMVASEITSTTIEVTVTASGNGMADNPEYTYYLNGEQKGEPANSNTYKYTDLTSNTEYTLKVTTKDSKNVVIEKEIKVTTDKKDVASDTVKDHISKIEVGDYVNYTPPTASYTVVAENSGYSSDQTFDSSNSAMNTWRVWKVDKTNNTIEIVSSTNTYKSLYLIGATGYNQGPTIINTICSKLYSNQKNYIVARSIDEEDIQEAMEENWGILRKTDLNKFITKLQTYYSDSVLYSSEDQIATSYVPNCYDTDDIGNLQNYDLRPSKNETKGYTQRNEWKCKNTYYYLRGDDFSESIGSLKHSIIGNSRGSWLASRSVEVRDHLVYFRIRTIVSNGGFFRFVFVLFIQ